MLVIVGIEKALVIIFLSQRPAGAGQCGGVGLRELIVGDVLILDVLF